MREEELQEQILDQIQRYIDRHTYVGIKAEKEVPIIKDCTFVYENDGFSMYLGHARTDVCIYVESQNLTSYLDESEFFKLYQNGDKSIRIPLVILETKRGDGEGKLNTDSIRSRTIIAREINEIFPFCGYFFVADRVGPASPGKVHRAGKHFDSFYTCDEEANQKWLRDNIMEQAIGPHMRELVGSGIVSKV